MEKRGGLSMCARAVRAGIIYQPPALTPDGVIEGRERGREKHLTTDNGEMYETACES